MHWLPRVLLRSMTGSPMSLHRGTALAHAKLQGLLYSATIVVLDICLCSLVRD